MPDKDKVENKDLVIAQALERLRNVAPKCSRPTGSSNWTVPRVKVEENLCSMYGEQK